MAESCLVQKLGHYVDLNESDKQALARLEEEEESYDARKLVFETGGTSDRLWVIKSGWGVSSIPHVDGRRQVVRVHLPGDVVGLPEIALKSAATTFETVTRCCLCPFPKRRLDGVFSNHPRLAALMFTIALREQVILIDTQKALGRMDARERLAHFLLDILARLRITMGPETDRMRMPMNQSDIGDHMGLTNVTVSKTLMRMELDGLIGRRCGNILFADEARMVTLCGFRDRYRDLDTSWFPADG